MAKKKKVIDYTAPNIGHSKNYIVTEGGFKMRKDTLALIKTIRTPKPLNTPMPLFSVELYEGMPRCCICKNPFTPREGANRNNYVCGRYYCISSFNKMIAKHKDPIKLFKKVNEEEKNRVTKKGLSKQVTKPPSN